MKVIIYKMLSGIEIEGEISEEQAAQKKIDFSKIDFSKSSITAEGIGNIDWVVINLQNLVAVQVEERE